MVSEQISLVKSACSADSNVFKCLAEAAGKPESCFHASYEKPYDLSDPEFSGFKACTRLLCARARFEAAQDRYAAAADDLRTIARMEAHLAQEPFLASFVAASSLHSSAVRAMVYILSASNGDPKCVEAMRQVNADFPALDPAFALRGESFTSYAMIQCLPTAPSVLLGTHTLPEVLPKGVSVDLAVKAWQARMLEFYADAMPIVRSKADCFAKQLEELGELAANKQDATYTAQSAVVDAVPGVLACTARDNALREVSRLGLEILSTHNKDASYPTKLPSDAPLDPCNGKPLVYKVDKDGFVLYSVGENLKDDGGHGDDQAFTYPLFVRPFSHPSVKALSAHLRKKKIGGMMALAMPPPSH